MPQGKSAKGRNEDNRRGFAQDPELAREAGRKGGHMSGGNFANDPERAREAGRKGGEHSHGGGRKRSEDQEDEER